MVPSPTTVTPTTTIADAAMAMARSATSLLPVVDDATTARITGLITDRDILERCVSARHGPGCVVRDHMTEHPLVTVAPDDALEVVVQRMEMARVHRVPVVERSGRVVGIVAREDVMI